MVYTYVVYQHVREKGKNHLVKRMSFSYYQTLTRSNAKYLK